MEVLVGDTIPTRVPFTKAAYRGVREVDYVVIDKKLKYPLRDNLNAPIISLHPTLYIGLVGPELTSYHIQSSILIDTKYICM